MGSSNNFYQQALHENKLLQMKILELKHKAALYEVCLGSIASILKDLPLQQKIDDTKHSQNAALHKIANVLTHIETVVKSNSDSQLHLNPSQNLSHNSLHLQQSKLQFYGSAGRPSFTAHHTATEIHQNSTTPSSSAVSHSFGEMQNFLGKPGPHQNHHPVNPHEHPHHVSTLSIHKCMKSAEPQPHTVGAMTISPIKFSQNYPLVMRRSLPVTLTKTVVSWPPSQTHMAGGSHSQQILDRKRMLPPDSTHFDDLLKKKAMSSAVETTAAQDVSTKQKEEEQAQYNIFKQAVEQAKALQKHDLAHRIDTGHPIQPNMIAQSANSFTQEKQSLHPQMLNGGNVVVNMANNSRNDSGINNVAKVQATVGVSYCDNRTNTSEKSNTSSAAASNCLSCKPLAADIPRKTCQVKIFPKTEISFPRIFNKPETFPRVLPKPEPAPVPIAIPKPSESQASEDSDCTIID